MTRSVTFFRKVALSMVGATLMVGASLWLVQPSHAATITVAAGVVAVDGGDGQCSLIEAIYNANDDAATHADCSAGAGPDIIELVTGSTYDLISAIGGKHGCLNCGIRFTRSHLQRS